MKMEERFGQYSKRRCLIYMEDTFRNELTRKQASKQEINIVWIASL